jgi:hypothetical protein
MLLEYDNRNILYNGYQVNQQSIFYMQQIYFHLVQVHIKVHTNRAEDL